MAPVKCPLCSTDIKLLQINLTEAFYMCPNDKCVYPIGCPDVNMEIILRDYKDTLQPATDINTSLNKDDDLDLDLNGIDEITLSNLIESVGEDCENVGNLENFNDFLDLSFFDDPKGNV